MKKFASSMLLLAALSPVAVAQTACFDNNFGPGLGLLDDDTAQGLPLGFTFNFGGVAYTDICVCSNGYIWLGATSVAGGDFSPTETELLNGAPRICPNWNDFNPTAAGSGDIHYIAVPASGTNGAYALVTWDNVMEYGTSNPVQMQVRFNDNDTYSVSYGSNPPISGTLTTDHIVGASPGGGALSNLISLAARPLNTGGDTFADIMPAGTFAYAATNMLYVPTVPGYQVLDNPCVPGASFQPVGVGCPAVVGLGAGDDTTHAVVLPFAFPHATGPFTDIYVSSNGFITFGLTNPGSGCCSGNAAALLAGAPRVSPYWSDLNCSDTSASGNGDVVTHTDQLTGDFLITWSGVGEFGVTPPANITFQIALSPTGSIGLRYATVTNATHTVLAGYSDGNGAADPGPSDLSAVAAPTVNTIYEVFDAATNLVDLSGLDFLLIPAGAAGYTVIPGAAGPFIPVPQAPVLTNQGGSLPSLGGTQLIDVSGLPATAFACINALSFSEAVPPIDLVILGAPGCTSYINFLSGGAPVLQFNITGGAPVATFSLSIPNIPSLSGTVLMSQALVPDPALNTLGFRFSNAARMIVGL